MITTPFIPEVGDLIVVGGHKVGEAQRTGEIREVLGEPAHPHYRVRWQDGHESVLYPSSDASIRKLERGAGLAEVTRTLESAAVSFELVRHERTQTAGDEADALHVAPRQVGKTLVVKAGDTRARVVVPADERLDLKKARAALDADKNLQLATESELGEWYRDFELGAVPPFGGPAGDRVVVDERLASLDTVVVEAGTHTESVRLSGSDLLAAAKADVADLCA
jgi:Ala-tRNA(Pro) deacylase